MKKLTLGFNVIFLKLLILNNPPKHIGKSCVDVVVDFLIKVFNTDIMFINFFWGYVLISKRLLMDIKALMNWSLTLCLNSERKSHDISNETSYHTT